MPLFQRPKTWSASDTSVTSSDHERSGSDLREVQREADRQAMLYEAQIHELQKVRASVR